MSMNEYHDILKRYFDRAEIKHALVDGFLWREYERMIMPAGPVCEKFHLSNKGARELFKFFPNAVLCRWSTPFENGSENSDFYAVICKSPTNIHQLPSKRRNEINRGLNNCKVSIVSPATIADDAYEVYIKATVGYGLNAVPKERFSTEFFLNEGFENLIHYWGVFADNKLIAYAKVYAYGNIEANIITAKFDPDYNKLYPSYALFHTINDFYLKIHEYNYVNDGFKSLYHETNIQDFLIKKFGYEKLPLNLYLTFRFPWNIFVKTAYPFGFILKKLSPKIKALLDLYQISEKNA